jgi:hypothetical protein
MVLIITTLIRVFEHKRHFGLRVRGPVFDDLELFLDVL